MSGADMFNTIRNNKGESLAETLVASLIIGLAMIMVLSIIQVTGGLSSKADALFSDYYSKMNLYELLELDRLDGDHIASSIAHVSLYDDGYYLGNDEVILYTDSSTKNGNTVNYSYFEVP